MCALGISGGVDRAMQQTTFASMAWQNKGKITRREGFLAEMDAVIPWSRLLALIEPHYPKAGNGTQPKPIEQHHLTERIFAEIRSLLERNGCCSRANEIATLRGLISTWMRLAIFEAMSQAQ